MVTIDPRRAPARAQAAERYLGLASAIFALIGAAAIAFSLVAG
jgi:hypothetical protein